MNLRLLVTCGIIITSFRSISVADDDLTIAIAKIKATGIYNILNGKQQPIKQPTIEELPPVPDLKSGQKETPKEEPKSNQTPKPEVLVFYAPFSCPPCDSFNSAITELKNKDKLKDLPFEFKFNKEPPVAIVHYPFVVWKNASGKWVYLDSWKGMQNLVDTWKFSQTTKQRVTILGDADELPTMSGYQHKWQWFDGALTNHMRSVHGIDVSYLNQDQLELIHDKLHDGYNINQIKSIISNFK